MPESTTGEVPELITETETPPATLAQPEPTAGTEEEAAAGPVVESATEPEPESTTGLVAALTTYSQPEPTTATEEVAATGTGAESAGTTEARAELLPWPSPDLSPAECFACFVDHLPVCGVDDVTYLNPCFAQCHSVGIVCSQACELFYW